MSDTGNRDDRGTPDVAESEAAAIAEETSAEQTKPDAGKDRRMSQGSGHASPSMGEQQAEVRPQ